MGLTVEMVKSLIGDCTLVLELPPLQLSLNFMNISKKEIITNNFIVTFPHFLNKTKNEKNRPKNFLITIYILHAD